MIRHGNIHRFAFCNNLATIEQNDVVAPSKRVQLVRCHDDRATFIAKQSKDAMLKQMRANLQTARIIRILMRMVIVQQLKYSNIYMRFGWGLSKSSHVRVHCTQRIVQ